MSEIQEKKIILDITKFFFNLQHSFNIIPVVCLYIIGVPLLFYCSFFFLYISIIFYHFESLTGYIRFWKEHQV